jgi:hypothetical protein
MVFTLDFPEGLAFHYQPPLTQEQINAGHIRPDDVIGSYAVYWKDRHHYKDRSGSTIVNYRTGKFCHIYRPRLIDALGNELWADLHIDPAAKTMTITMDGKWLDAAAYPVTLDPTFGYTTAGASTLIFENWIAGTIGTPASDGTADSITWYGNGYTHSVKCAVYDDSDDSFQFGSAGRSDLNSTYQWWTHTVSGSPSVSSAITYAIVAWSNAAAGATRIGYDTVTNEGRRQSLTYGSWPDPATLSTDNYKCSVYATYTEGGGQSYSYTMSGGALAGGAGPFQRGVTLSPSGGGLVGGSGPYSRTAGFLPSGGGLVGGSGSHSRTVGFSPSGGGLGGGGAGFIISVLVAMSGGAVTGGTAPYQWIGTQLYEYIMSGGATAGGLAGILRTLVLEAAGGTVAGGAAEEARGRSHEASGGAVIGGEAALLRAVNILFEGGAISGGAAGYLRTLILEASGGAVLGGAAAYELFYEGMAKLILARFGLRKPEAAVALKKPAAAFSLRKPSADMDMLN